MRTITDAYDSSSGLTVRLGRLLRRLWCRHRQVRATSTTAGIPARVVCTACGWHEPVLTPIPRDTRRNGSSPDATTFELARRRRAANGERRRLALSHLAAGEQTRPAPPRRAAVVPMKPASGE